MEILAIAFTAIFLLETLLAGPGLHQRPVHGEVFVRHISLRLFQNASEEAPRHFLIQQPLAIFAEYRVAYDTRDFVQVLREMQVQPHVTQNLNRRGGSAIDGRTTRHASYHISQKKRPLIERAFGWMKSIGGIRKVKLRGLRNVDWLFLMTAAAFNLWRIPKLKLAEV